MRREMSLSDRIVRLSRRSLSLHGWSCQIHHIMLSYCYLHGAALILYSWSVFADRLLFSSGVVLGLLACTSAALRCTCILLRQHMMRLAHRFDAEEE